MKNPSAVTPGPPGAAAVAAPPPPAGPPATVGTSAFTLVEEDDVAFSLRLCREVHLLYGDYQDGRLPSTDPVMAGLSVTVEMLAALSRSVRAGMPAMRVTVAAAQTREMLTVMFGLDPLEEPLDRRLRARYRSMVGQSAVPDAPAARGDTGSPPALRPAAPPVDPAPGAGTKSRRRGLLRRLLRRDQPPPPPVTPAAGG